jgi:hypothetical protein
MSDGSVGRVGSGGPLKGNYGTSLSSNPYNPQAVQDQINAILATIKKGEPLSFAQINYIMQLAGTYKSDVLGNDAAELAQINKYMNDITDLTNMMTSASDLSTSAGLTSADNPTLRFKEQVLKLANALNKKFFKTGAGSSLTPQISTALDNVLTSVFGVTNGQINWSNSALQDLWVKTSGSPGVSGDPDQMNQVQQALGSVQQIYTGVSKSSQATVQSDSSELTAVQNAMNTMEKKIFDLMAQIIQSSKTG